MICEKPVNERKVSEVTSCVLSLFCKHFVLSEPFPPP